MDTTLQFPKSLFAWPVRYEIRPFQRRYVWKQEEQWEPLWDDIEALAQSIMEDGETEPHFMGAVVFQQKRSFTGTIERRIVVDGQQRLITLQLLIHAIQEVLEGRDHSCEAKRLSDLVANGEQYRNGKRNHAFKVWPTFMDRDAFRHAMSNGPPVRDRTTSRVVQAHEYFKGQAEQWLDRFPEGNKGRKRDRAASALEEAVGSKLQIVVIDLGDSDDPHAIFETLNARGTPLLQSDMVKNKLLHDAQIERSDGDPSKKERRLWPFDQDDWWARDIGRGLQRRPRVDVYLNHWLTLRNRAEMKPYDEFSAFKNYARTRTIKRVAADMRKIGRIYRDIEEFRRPDVARFLKRRNVMNVGVVTPLLLWLLSADLREATLENCVTALESFLVRRIVCGYHARSYGRLFVDLIAKLADNPVDRADDVLVDCLAEQTAPGTLWPDDRKLRESFLTAPLYQSLARGSLRMVLEGIEEELRTDMAESREVSGNLHIEHVMPQTWQENWPLSGDAANHDEVVANRDRPIHTIGNLTLVTSRLNTTLSNAPWKQKRKTLSKHSVLFLNKRLVDQGSKKVNVWDEKAIRKRAKWLHEQAVRIWPHANE